VVLSGQYHTHVYGMIIEVLQFAEPRSSDQIARVFAKNSGERRRAEAKCTIAAGGLDAGKMFSSRNIDTHLKLLSLFSPVVIEK